MKRALVFAGNSFIGRWLIRELHRRDWTITNAVRRPSAGGDLACDVLDAARVDELIATTKPNWVFQLGGATTGNDPRAALTLHVTGSMNVLEAVRRHAPEAGVLLVGSAAEYGNASAESLPLREDQPCSPCSFFGASKLAQTNLAGAAAAEWGLRLASVRPFNVIGPGLPEHYFAASLAARLRQSPPAREFPIANAHATRDFVDVRDVAEGMVGLAEVGQVPGGQHTVFNIATGVETSLLAMAQELGRLAGGFVPVAGEQVASRGGITRSCGDATRLRQATRWKPGRSWQESLRDLWSTGELRNWT